MSRGCSADIIVVASASLLVAFQRVSISVMRFFTAVLILAMIVLCTVFFISTHPIFGIEYVLLITHNRISHSEYRVLTLSRRVSSLFWKPTGKVPGVIDKPMSWVCTWSYMVFHSLILGYSHLPWGDKLAPIASKSISGHVGVRAPYLDIVVVDNCVYFKIKIIYF